MDKFRDMADTCACIGRRICATSCTLSGYCNALVDPVRENEWRIRMRYERMGSAEHWHLPSSCTGMAGTSWHAIAALDRAPTAALANWWQSTHRSLHWLYPGIWWSLPYGVAEWTRQHGRIDRTEPCEAKMHMHESRFCVSNGKVCETSKCDSHLFVV